ncbi:MAG TPA: ABC transporter substrate-binding protein, partial [Candidatus Obscuribacterales bacterium]
MLNRNSLGKLLAAMLVSGMVAGCAGRPKHEGQASTMPNTSGTEAKSAIATPVNPTSPGPYKTTEVNGLECKQGRFPEGKFGGTLVRPLIASDPKTFNPWVSADSGSSEMGGLMFSGLLTMDPYSGEMIPDMAESFEIKPDHLTYVVKLRKGLKWSDGQPITADDVAFTFNTIVGQGYGNTSARDVIAVDGKMPTVTAVDPQTVQFVTAKPFVP